MKTPHVTGHPLVDAITRFNVFLNALVIPRLWFKHITMPRRKGTREEEAQQPDLNAIMILADILFWYTAKLIYDEQTGQVVGARKRFKDTMLQRSLVAFGTQYGLSKTQVYHAKERLEALGLIRTEERTLHLPDGRHIPRQLFWEPIPEAIESITFEKSTMLSVDNTPRSSLRDLKEDPPQAPPEGGERRAALEAKAFPENGHARLSSRLLALLGVMATNGPQGR